MSLATENPLASEVKIREALMAQLAGKGLLVPEVCIDQWSCRVDLAILNTDFHGYEIKSESDSLRRLPRQMQSYLKVCNTVTLVCTRKHVEPALLLLPASVAIKVARLKSDGSIDFDTIHTGRQNVERKIEALAALLWRVEAQALLREAGFRGYSRLRRHELAAAIADYLDHDVALQKVMAILRRRDWRGWNGEPPSARVKVLEKALPKVRNKEAYERAMLGYDGGYKG